LKKVSTKCNSTLCLTQAHMPTSNIVQLTHSLLRGIAFIKPAIVLRETCRYRITPNVVSHVGPQQAGVLGPHQSLHSSQVRSQCLPRTSQRAT
jgi:hypothetical protein